MNTEEHDELWELLGRARQPKPSPLFARNVLREVRNLEQEKPGFLSWLRAHWRGPVVAFGAVAVAAVFTLRQALPVKSPAGNQEAALVAFAQTVSDSPDYHVISHLDELLDTDDNSVWLDTY